MVYPFLGLAAEREACITFRKSLLMLASSFLVGTFFNSCSLCFSLHWRFPLTLIDVINLFDTDEKCRELLGAFALAKWSSNACAAKAKLCELETAKQLFYCKECDYQFTVTAGTIFNDSHLAAAKVVLGRFVAL